MANQTTELEPHSPSPNSNPTARGVGGGRFPAVCVQQNDRPSAPREPGPDTSNSGSGHSPRDALITGLVSPARSNEARQSVDDAPGLTGPRVRPRVDAATGAATHTALMGRPRRQPRQARRGAAAPVTRR
ncbi:hypothetical protein ISCGN_025316 [Ixodes scapularis]